MASKRGQPADEGGDNDGADVPETKKKRGNSAVAFSAENTVQVTGGPFRNYIGTVKSVDTNAGTVKLSVSPTRKTTRPKSPPPSRWWSCTSGTRLPNTPGPASCSRLTCRGTRPSNWT
jgi:hypothetical protein